MNCKKLSFAIVQILSIAFVSLSAQTKNQPFFRKEIESGMQAVLMENKEYADAKAKSDAIQKQIESLQEKLASNDPELKKLLEENKKLISRINFLLLENSKFKHIMGSFYTKQP